MKALVQRVSRASVEVDGCTVGEIGKGLLILLGVGENDTTATAAKMAEKCAHMRVMEDAERKMNLSILDTGDSALVVSQFTLYADCRKGRRPSFTGSAGPEEGERLYEEFCSALLSLGVAVQTGMFRAHMEVSLVNDGPVTIWLDSDEVLAKDSG